MDVDLIRVWCACLVTSTEALRFELSVACAHNLDACASVVRWHIKVRRWLGLVS